MSEAEAVVSSRRRIPAIWLVPVVAFVLGIWMVAYTYMTEGPEITIVFSTAEGIEAGKTKLKTLNVEVGLVEEVFLSDDMESVTLRARLKREAASLLRDDTRFWVVRPRFGTRGISGLGTVMSGAYIELEAGSQPTSRRRHFVGLDDLPVTPVGTPGLKLVLTSGRAGSVDAGDPVLYKGFQVGKVENTVFDSETKRARHAVFIEAPYDELVNGATRFWEASGISVQATAEGMRVDVGSVQSLLTGGVSFGVPDGTEPGPPSANGAEFVLYDRYESAREEIYRHSVEYVVSFVQSVRGLEPGAPVEYRGIPVGSVRGILLEDLARERSGGTGRPIPVLISLEPGRMRIGDTAEAASRLRAQLERGVAQGLRGSLQSGNLLTGSLLVSFDYYPEEGAAEIGRFAGYPTLPTMPGGLERIERKVSDLLAKLNDLPLDDTVRELNATLAEVRRAVGSAELRELPAEVDDSLSKLDRTLQSVEQLARKLEQQPSSLIFSQPGSPDPEPRSAP